MNVCHWQLAKVLTYCKSWNLVGLEGTDPLFHARSVHVRHVCTRKLESIEEEADKSEQVYLLGEIHIKFLCLARWLTTTLNPSGKQSKKTPGSKFPFPFPPCKPSVPRKFPTKRRNHFHV